jgi:hypothetical protein
MIRGLPSRPPAGERVLWQGSPVWPSLARRAFHVRLIAAYFAVLLAYAAVHGLMIGYGAGQVASSTAKFAAFAAVPVALTLLYAWRVGATTVYTITNRRVAIRMGVALPMTLNVPFTRVDGAAVHRAADGTGDLTLQLARGNRLSYLILWPHARPWRLLKAQPMLRAIPHPERVGQVLARALAASAEQTVPAMEELHAGHGAATIGAAHPQTAEAA